MRCGETTLLNEYNDDNDDDAKSNVSFCENTAVQLNLNVMLLFFKRLRCLPVELHSICFCCGSAVRNPHTPFTPSNESSWSTNLVYYVPSKAQIPLRRLRRNFPGRGRFGKVGIVEFRLK